MLIQNQNLDKQFLLISILGIVTVFIVANLVGQEDYPLTEDWYPTDVLFLAFPGIALVFGMVISVKYRGKGNHGKAWILFSLAVACWYVGELTYSYDEEYISDDLSTLTSDIFYIAGYPLFFGFTVFYLKPRKRIISKKMILLTSLVVIGFMIPSLIYSLDVDDEEVDQLTIFLYGIYPVLDSLILGPAVIAIYLFIQGKVNLLWIAILISVVIDLVADTFWIILSLDELYYPGHPIDILYLIPYVLYIFGISNHLKLYKKSLTI